MVKIAEISSHDRLASFKRSNIERCTEILAVLTIIRARRPDVAVDPRVSKLESLAAGLEMLRTIVTTADGSSKAA